MNAIFHTKKEKTSSYGLRVCAITAALLIVLIGINLLVGLLPNKMTSFDISVDHRYSITDSAKRALSKVDRKIDIYMLSSGGEKALADQGLHVNIFLSRMVEYSDQISFRTIDPLTEPDLVNELGLTQAGNLSILVKSQDRQRILPLSSFFNLYIDGIGKVTAEQAQLYLSYYGDQINILYGFEGENLILNAIAYVTADFLPKIYMLAGHGETALADDLLKTFENNNILSSTLTLNESGVPSDCSILFVNLPTSDLSASETQLIKAYMAKGGKMILITAPASTSPLLNFMDLAGSFGLKAEDGIVIESNSDYYYQLPYYLLPSVTEHAATEQALQNYRTMLPFSHGIEVASDSDATVTPLFSTSAESYIIPTDAQTVEKPDGQDAKVHNIGVLSEKQNGSTLLWISSQYATDVGANSYFSGGNFVYLTEIMRYISNAPKPVEGDVTLLSVDMLQVPAVPSTLISIVGILLIPTTIIGFGFVYWLRRRRK